MISLYFLRLPVPPESPVGPPVVVTLVVGHDEEPFASVGRADVRRLDERFLDAVANALKVWSYNVEVSEPKMS
jgi:hypothetical protein